VVHLACLSLSVTVATDHKPGEVTEAMVETQLRYMGGLSDVNWLVDDGLKDINTESALVDPILFGARLRF
jgi:hypothetical protein